MTWYTVDVFMTDTHTCMVVLLVSCAHVWSSAKMKHCAAPLIDRTERSHNEMNITIVDGTIIEWNHKPIERLLLRNA